MLFFCSISVPIDIYLSRDHAKVASRFAIDALIASYAEAFDTLNMDLLATLWHPDSRLLLGANGDAEGLDAILAQARVNMKRMPHMHHWMANALITVEGDRGHGVVAADCQYRDIYERRGGRWAFLQRVFDMHFATPLQNWVPVAGTERFGLPV